MCSWPPLLMVSFGTNNILKVMYVNEKPIGQSTSNIYFTNTAYNQLANEKRKTRLIKRFEIFGTRAGLSISEKQPNLFCQLIQSVCNTEVHELAR